MAGSKKSSTSRISTDTAAWEQDVRVGTYTRRSTTEDNQPYSIEAQDARLDSYIDSQPGWRRTTSFTDDASGASTERPGLQRALQAARAGVINVLVVYRVDRFSRNLRDLVTLLDELDRAKVVFRSAIEPFDTSTPMGRMLVQMLGMFAQFERDTIIDRVIAGMERKAAKGLWKGGKRPYGYRVDKTTQTLVVDEAEAVVVRMIFDLYTCRRLGARAVAAELNTRGHRASTGREWSGHHVLRILNSRIYLGELTFRDTTVTDTHPALVDNDIFEHAQSVLEARGESHAHRAANSSDYLLTGRLRCPRCGRAMIGTRATGRSRTYRYYTCFNRARYDSDKCDFTRLDADSVDAAVLEALGKFYRTRHDLISQAIHAQQRYHRDASIDLRAELATVSAELAKAQQAIDRYLNAFENGTLDPELLAGRLSELRAQTTQLATRRDELTATLASEPTTPEPAALDGIADTIAEIIATGTHTQTKALIEVLVARVAITGPDRLLPTFRIPQPGNDIGADTASAVSAPMESVRAMPRLVDVGGTYYNTNMQVDALEKLLAKLPDLTVPAPTSPVRPAPKRAHQLERRLTDTERAEIIAAYEAGSSAKRLSAQWQLAKASILHVIRSGGVAIRQQRRLTDGEIDHAATRYQNGESLHRIGDHLGVAHTTIRSALQRRGIPRRDTHGRSR